MTEKEKLESVAIKELKKLVRDPDKKIRLRALSLILRHSNKAKSKLEGESEIDKFLEGFTK